MKKIVLAVSLVFLSGLAFADPQVQPNAPIVENKVIKTDEGDAILIQIITTKDQKGKSQVRSQSFTKLQLQDVVDQVQKQLDKANEMLKLVS